MKKQYSFLVKNGEAKQVINGAVKKYDLDALYELIEWSVAVSSGSEAVKFLATQGDPWDTHWDMLLALCGAVSALLLLAGVHDRALRNLNRQD